MSTTLSYGYKKPVAPDPASLWMPEHEDNVQQLNDHDHDGVNSAPVNGLAIDRESGSILAAGWAVVPGGFQQTVTAPAGVSEINQHFLKFVSTAGLAGAGAVIYPEVTRVTGTTYTVKVNDVTLAMTVYYI